MTQPTVETHLRPSKPGTTSRAGLPAQPTREAITPECSPTWPAIHKTDPSDSPGPPLFNSRQLTGNKPPHHHWLSRVAGRSPENGQSVLVGLGEPAFDRLAVIGACRPFYGPNARPTASSSTAIATIASFVHKYVATSIAMRHESAL